VPAITTDRPSAEKIGTVIGPYKLREKIGEGGFGVVYVAEQEKPVVIIVNKWDLVLEGADEQAKEQLAKEVPDLVISDMRLGHDSGLNVLKALPPLVVDEDDLDLFVAALDETVSKAEKMPRALVRFALTAARAGRTPRKRLARA